MPGAKAVSNLDTPLEDYEFDIRASPDDKFQYGEIFSPLGLIKDMFAMLPAGAFNNPDARWLDPGAGTGHFSLVLYHRLMDGLFESIPNCSERRQHIISKMLYMVEIYPDWEMKRVGALALVIFLAYKGPEIFLKNKATKRTDAIRKGLPDALDLLVICAEAGLTVDAFVKGAVWTDADADPAADAQQVQPPHCGLLRGPTRSS